MHGHVFNVATPGLLPETLSLFTHTSSLILQQPLSVADSASLQLYYQS